MESNPVKERETDRDFLAVRMHDQEIMGPFASFKLAAQACFGQGPCFVFEGTFNAAWGEAPAKGA